MSKELDQALAGIKKQFGAGAVMPLSQSAAAEPVEVISTGCAAIDQLTGVGGIPRGRVTELFGTESSGKSTLCLQLVARAQKSGGVAAYIDVEQALDLAYAKQLGVDVDNLLVSQPDNGEEALEIALALIHSGAIALVVVDSVAALVPKAELEGDMGQPTMGLQARLMGSALRKLTAEVARSGTALVFINQLRDKLGISFGDPTVTPGGRALKFFASLRLDVRRISQIKKGDNIIGANTKIKTAKNKLSAPLKTCEVELIYGKGFTNEED
jgi:recombination protein RecA